MNKPFIRVRLFGNIVVVHIDNLYTSVNTLMFDLDSGRGISWFRIPFGMPLKPYTCDKLSKLIKDSIIQFIEAATNTGRWASKSKSNHSMSITSK